MGNPYRGDDGVGRFIAQRLKARRLDGVKVLGDSGEATSLMSAWEGADEVILIDAVVSGSKPGTIFHFDASVKPLPKDLFKNVSTHSFGVAEAIELTRAMNRLPPKVFVYGIEGKCFDDGSALSEEVKLAAEEVIARLLLHLSL
ncbi:hydrogenase maturation protease [bacterium]|nr:hydrogenase maturation protease [bacterium]